MSVVKSSTPKGGTRPMTARLRCPRSLFHLLRRVGRRRGCTKMRWGLSEGWDWRCRKGFFCEWWCRRRCLSQLPRRWRKFQLLHKKDKCLIKFKIFLKTLSNIIKKWILNNSIHLLYAKPGVITKRESQNSVFYAWMTSSTAWLDY